MPRSLTRPPAPKMMFPNAGPLPRELPVLLPSFSDTAYTRGDSISGLLHSSSNGPSCPPATTRAFVSLVFVFVILLTSLLQATLSLEISKKVLNDPVLSRGDLANCARVSRSFLLVVRTRLFAKITFAVYRRDGLEALYLLTRRIYQLFETLTRVPEIAGLVKDLRFEVKQAGRFFSLAGAEQVELEEVVEELLPALDNLEQLRMTDEKSNGPTLSSLLEDPVLSSVTFLFLANFPSTLVSTSPSLTQLDTHVTDDDDDDLALPAPPIETLSLYSVPISGVPSKPWLLLATVQTVKDLTIPYCPWSGGENPDADYPSFNSDHSSLIALQLEVFGPPTGASSHLIMGAVLGGKTKPVSPKFPSNLDSLTIADDGLGKPIPQAFFRNVPTTLATLDIPTSAIRPATLITLIKNRLKGLKVLVLEATVDDLDGEKKSSWAWTRTKSTELTAVCEEKGVEFLTRVVAPRDVEWRWR
ncbi:hypothetical protein JCM11641_003891 [Rhodosporidiobolus odoratus]